MARSPRTRPPASATSPRPALNAGIRNASGGRSPRRTSPRSSRRWTSSGQAFFTLLVQTGVRIGELLGLTWGNVHLGDDPHILVAEQFYKGQRKRLKTEASKARVPLSHTTAAWLAELRPADAAANAPVFPSITGTPLTYSNMYNRVLRPALIDAGIAINRGSADRPDWDYRGVAFHAFRKACGSLLFANGKTLKQVQGFLRHSQLTTTMNVYIDQVDNGLGSADVWDTIFGAGGPTGGPNRESGQAVEAESPVRTGL